MHPTTHGDARMQSRCAQPDMFQWPSMIALTMAMPEGTVASASARVNAPIMVPRTLSGKIATAASVQRSREFATWLAELPALSERRRERDSQ